MLHTADMMLHGRGAGREVVAARCRSRCQGDNTTDGRAHPRHFHLSLEAFAVARVLVACRIPLTQPIVVIVVVDDRIVLLPADQDRITGGARSGGRSALLWLGVEPLQSSCEALHHLRGCIELQLLSDTGGVGPVEVVLVENEVDTG